MAHSLKQTIRHKHGGRIVVTTIEQTTLPTYLHGDDIKAAIKLVKGFYEIDFHGFKRSVYGPPETRDLLYGEALDYFREQGVNLQGGTYCHDGWVSVEDHMPRPNDWVLVYAHDCQIVAQHDSEHKLWWMKGGHNIGGVTHWRQLPPNPHYEQQFRDDQEQSQVFTGIGWRGGQE